QVLGGIRIGLRDLVGDLLDRTLALREDVDDLHAPAAAERLRHRRKRVEERPLRWTTRHILNISIDYLSYNVRPSRPGPVRRLGQRSRMRLRVSIVGEA